MSNQAARLKIVRVSDSWQVPNVDGVSLERSIESKVASLNFPYIHNTELAENDVVDVSIDFFSGSWTKAFSGPISTKKAEGERFKIMSMTARDKLYSLRRGNVAKSYSLVTLGDIVKDVVAIYELGFGTSNVQDIALIDKVNLADRAPLSPLLELCETHEASLWLRADGELFLVPKGGGSIVATFGESDVRRFNPSDTGGIEREVKEVVVKGGVFQGNPIYEVAYDASATAKQRQLARVIFYRPDIDDPALAKQFAMSALNRYKPSMKVVEFELLTPMDIYAGSRVTVDFPTIGVAGTFDVLNSRYDFAGGKLTHALTIGKAPRSEVDPLVDLYSRVAVLERARETVADLVSAGLVAAPNALTDIDFPIDPDELQNCYRDRTDDCQKLISGQISGNFIVRYDPPREEFLAWDRLAWEIFEEEGSVSVSLLDVTGATIRSGLTSPMDLLPYPPDLDAAEWLPSDWGMINATSIENSYDAIFGTYSMKTIFPVGGVARGFYFPYAKNMALDLSEFRVLRTQFEIDGESAIEVRLHTDDSNYFRKQTVTIPPNDWEPFCFPLDQSEWTAVGSPNWNSINYVAFIVPSSNTSVLALFVDGVRFERLSNEQVALKFSLTRPSADKISPRVRSITWEALVGGR